MAHFGSARSKTGTCKPFSTSTLPGFGTYYVGDSSILVHDNRLPPAHPDAPAFDLLATAATPNHASQEH